MWRHQAGRIDFVGPLWRLWRRGWGFREYGPTVGARDDGHWAVVGVNGGARVRGDRPERKEAWAEAVRLALAAAIGRRSLLTVPLSGTVGARRHPSRSPRPSARRDRHRHRSGARDRRGTGPGLRASRGGPEASPDTNASAIPGSDVLIGPEGRST